MVTYEYECTACKKRHEVQQRMTDEPLTICPECGKEGLRKVFSKTSIQFKGSGFYITDYERKGQGESSGGSCGTGGCCC